MRNILRYILLLAILALVQVSFIDRLAMGTYIQPLIYACFVVMLPLELGRVQTLLIGALAGVFMDFLSGTPGLNTIATTAIAYIRPWLLYQTIGLEEIRNGGVPSRRRHSPAKVFFYAFYMFLLHSLVYFGVETLSVAMLTPILIRAAISTAICLGVFFIADNIFNSRVTN